MENKNSFFSLTLDTSQIHNNEWKLEKLENAIDLILSAMQVNQIWYKFVGINEIIYLFKTETRKRRGQVIKACEGTLPKEQNYEVQALTKFSYDQDLKRLQKNTNFKFVHKPNIFENYSGRDIAIFNNRKNWYKWQKEFYDMVFDENGNFKQADERKIIHLYCKTGNSGKSSFFKWLFYNHPDEIGRLGYGTAAQLRSAATNLGKKKCYIIDLARSRSKQDKTEDLLSSVEDIKTGLVSGLLFGAGKTLVMEPPHVIISSNYLFNYSALSEDRWLILEIKKDKSLKQLTKNQVQRLQSGGIVSKAKKY